MSVSLDGDRALIGAYTDDDRGFDSGSAYVFERSGTWSQRAKLLAADGASVDHFGWSVSLDGDRALVGAYQGDASSRESDSGSAYVFVRSGTSWLQEEELTASDARRGDRFGYSVSLSGDRALIGAYRDDGDSGSAYVFGRSSSIWSQGLKLTASDGANGDRFGFSVSLDGNNALVGAYLEDKGGGDAGAVYVIEDGAFLVVRNLGTSLSAGIQNAVITPSLLSAEDQVHTPSQITYTVTTPPARGTLSLSVFTQADIDNELLTYTHTGVDDTDDSFGFEVTNGNTTLPETLFQIRVNPVGSDPTEFKLIASDRAFNDQFGLSVSLDGDRALIGSYLDDDEGSSSGSAYVFVNNSTGWALEAKLTSGEQMASDVFGRSVSLSGNRALVGSNGDDDPGSGSGSAYVFLRTGCVWSQEAKLLASDGASNDNFGLSVSLDGTQALVGAYVEDARTTDSGSAYVFVYNGSSWTQEQKIFPNDGSFQDRFGISVSLDGDRALIGAYTDDDRGTDSGSAYVFERSGTWSQRAKLLAADGASGDRFGWSVSLDGDRGLVGAYLDDAPSTDSGSAYVFVRTSTSWLQEEKLTASDGTFQDYFGYSVSLSGDRALIGAYRDDDRGNGSGSAYVFGWSSSIWSQGLKLTASDGANGDRFGFSVSLDGNNALVGSYLDDEGGSNAGAVYILQEGPPFELVTNEGLSLDEGASEIITNILLSAGGGPSDTDQMVFTLTAVPTNGALKLNTTDLDVSDTFTQEDADNNLVSYAHDGSETTSDSFTFTLSDGRTTLPEAAFQITVIPVNDPPTFTKGPDQTVPEDASEQSVPNWATNISPGEGETGQTVTFDLNADNTALFAVQPTIDPTGTLTYTPAPDANGSTTVAVSLGDDGGTDNGGTNTSASQTFTIEVTPVNDAPVADAGPDQANDDAVECSAIPTQVALDGSGSSDLEDDDLTFSWEGPFGTTTGVNPTVPLPLGSHTIELTVSDGDSTDTDQVVVEVVDTVPPVVVTQNIVIQLDENGITSITAEQVDDGSSDVCGIASLAVSPSSFTCEEVGANEVTLTVTDEGGNSATGTATVTVQDVTPPTVVTNNITVDLDASGNVSIGAADVNDGSSDACGIESLALTPNSFDCTNVGDNTVTLTVTDVNGNSAEGTATVTVRDVTPPEVATKNITVDLDEFGNASIVAADVDDGSSDACGIANLSVSTTTFDCNSVGDNEVTLTVTDVNGNSAEGTAIVTVRDVTPPTVVTKNTMVDLDEFGNASIVATDVDDGSSDACGIADLSVSPNAFDCNNLGFNTVTLTVTDNHGNISTATAAVTVNDVTPPDIVTITDTQTLECTNPIGEEIAMSVTATDLCDDELEYAWTDEFDAPLGNTPNITAKFGLGDHTATVVVTDDSGNSENGIVSILVRDTTPPEISAALNQTWGHSGDDDDDDDDDGGTRYEVAVSAEDICDEEPVITSYISQPLTGLDVDIKYKHHKKKNEIKIKIGKNIRVELKGPDEGALRDLLDGAIALGGFPVSDGQIVKLVSKGLKGVAAKKAGKDDEEEDGDDDDDDNNGKQSYKYDFDLNLVLTSAKGPGIHLAAFADDASENRSDVVIVFPLKQMAAKLALSKPDLPEAETDGYEFEVEQNYPNPFNPSTTIRYTLAEGSHVRLVIYNILGQQVQVLENDIRAPGFYAVRWEGKDNRGRSVSSGMYFYRLEAGPHMVVRKMVLTK